MDQLTKSQKQFIKNVMDTEQKLDQSLWLRMTYDGKWFMGTHEDDISEVGFSVHGKTLKSLTDKDILVNKEYYNPYSDSMLTGMALNDAYREMVAI